MSAHGMATHALAGEIVAAVVADEADGGCDISAGMFGPALSALIRRLAADYLRHADALNDIQARVASGYFVDAAHLGDIARAALVPRTPAEQPEQDVNGT